jgi:methionyl-tRNA formyltransferase
MVATGPPLRVVFFGTPRFAVPTLELLSSSPHHVVAVVTQPDRPSGRGHKTSDAPVKAYAASAAIPVLQPGTLKDAGVVASLKALQADIGVVAAYGKLLPEAVLNVPRLGMINVHASLLPRYRGAAPIHRAVIAGDHETGVTIMRVVKALDAGPILATTTRPIGPDETSEDVERDLARSGADLLVATLDRMAAGNINEIPQDDAMATYAPRLSKEDGIIDWQLPALSIHNLIRGLHPWPHAYSFLRGRRLILLKSSFEDSTPAAAPGSIVKAEGDALHVATGHGELRIHTLQPEGKRAMGPRDFLAGQQLTTADRFTPQP